MQRTRLVLVRHGETEWNVCGRLQNHLDSPLTELGQLQAARLAARLQPMTFDAFYSSDLGRAVATASVIGDALGQSFQLLRDLREQGMGCFEGRTWEQIRIEFPEDHARYVRDETLAVTGGESRQFFQERVVRGCEHMAAQSPGGTILAVTHGHALDVFLRFVVGIPLAAHRPARLPNASVNIFEKHDNHWIMALWGDVNHLVGLADSPHP